MVLTKPSSILKIRLDQILTNVYNSNYHKRMAFVIPPKNNTSFILFVKRRNFQSAVGVKNVYGNYRVWCARICESVRVLKPQTNRRLMPLNG